MSRPAPRMLNASPAPASSRGVVYRSLALPGQLAAGPLALESSSSAMTPPTLAKSVGAPHATDRGEVLWDAKRPSPSPSSPAPAPTLRKLPPTLLAVPPTTFSYAPAADAPDTDFVVRTSSLEALETAVSTSLSARSVDFSYDSAKYAWRVAAYDASSGEAMRARIGVLRVPEKADVFVLDFDRYCGCPRRFADMILDVYADLLAAQLAMRCARMVGHLEARSAAATDALRRPRAALAPPPALPASCCSDSANSADPSSYDSLRAACASTLIDVQLEALRCACALLASRPDARPVLASYGLSTDLAAVAVESRCAEARRLAVTALASLACDDVARVVATQMGLVDAVVAALARSAADAAEERETRRQAARALDALATVSEGAKTVASGLVGVA